MPQPSLHVIAPAYAPHASSPAARMLEDSQALADRAGWDLHASELMHQPLPRGQWHPAVDRQADLAHAIANAAAIACYRGGYGCTHLIETALDTPAPAQPPKLLGFSDITVLHACFHTRNWHGGFYGPIREAGRNPRWSLSVDAWLAAQQAHPQDPASTQATWHLTPGSNHPAPGTPESDPIGSDGESAAKPNTSFVPQSSPPASEPANTGNHATATAEGPLFAACTSVLAALCGTPAQPKLAGHILALEDIDERPYRWDRHLTQLHLSGVLDGIQALLIGSDTHTRPPKSGEPNMVDLWHTWQDRLQIPIVTDLPFGHLDDPCVLPQGWHARLIQGEQTQIAFRPNA